MLSCQLGKPSMGSEESTFAMITEDASTTPDDRRIFANASPAAYKTGRISHSLLQVEMSHILSRGMEASRLYSRATAEEAELLGAAIDRMELELEQWWETWHSRVTIGLSETGCAESWLFALVGG